MTPVDNLITGLESLLLDLNTIGVKVMGSQGMQYAILNLNREQMDAGLDSEGNFITLDGSPDYSPYTISIKQAKGQPTDRITLRDTGQFYENLRAEVDDEAVTISDTDIKTFEIEERTGPVIFGIMPDNQDRIKDLLRPLYEGEINNNLIPNLLAR